MAILKAVREGDDGFLSAISAVYFTRTSALFKNLYYKNMKRINFARLRAKYRPKHNYVSFKEAGPHI